MRSLMIFEEFWASGALSDDACGILGAGVMGRSLMMIEELWASGCAPS